MSRIPLTTDALIQHIARLQGHTGLFPSIRSNPALLYRRADTNVFFTASTVFTLQKLRPALSPDSQTLIDQIQERAVATYSLFRNKDGLPTYNFWPTKPSQHFANGHVFRHFDHFRIPDDIDDTAMVCLTTQPGPDNLLWLKMKLAQHANGTNHQIINTYADYRNLRAYSTWFGKTMPIDFDACALSNILYCIYHYNLPRNQHDADSLTYLRLVVESGRYTSEPFQCAPHYARPSLIIYHLARLMAAFVIPELEPIRSRLIADARHEFGKVTNCVERLILTTALIRLGGLENWSAVDLNQIDRDFSEFHFFIAGLLTAYEQPMLRRFANRPLTQMRWQCEAHCWTLVAENQVLMRNRN